MYTSLHAHTYKHLPLLSAKQSWIAQFSLFKKKKGGNITRCLMSHRILLFMDILVY